MKSEEINVILTDIRKLYKLNTTLKARAILTQNLCCSVKMVCKRNEL